jgi:hypothetical protein
MPGKPTYNFICFSDLAYEFDPAQKKVVEKKIRRRLKYYKLDAYDQHRVDDIRKLRNDLATEIGLNSASRYYQKSGGMYADRDDFNIPQMVADYGVSFPGIDNADMTDVVNFAIYIFYLR